MSIFGGLPVHGVISSEQCSDGHRLHKGRKGWRKGCRALLSRPFDSLSGRTGALSSSSSLIRQCLADLITIRDGSALIDRSITRIEPSKSKSQRLADAIMLRAALSIRQRYDVTITAMVHSPGRAGWQIGDVQVPAGLTKSTRALSSLLAEMRSIQE